MSTQPIFEGLMKHIGQGRTQGHVYFKKLLNWSWLMSCHLLKQSASERLQSRICGVFVAFFKDSIIKLYYCWM